MPVSTATAGPGAGEIARIAAYPDAVLRNLLITACYHQLAQALRRYTGPGANWCTFATWASRQAGRTIRREDLRDALEERLRGSPEVRHLAEAARLALRGTRAAVTVGAVLDDVVRALDAEGALTRASAAVAAGNLKVFEEIGALFARFLEAIEDPAARARFLDSLQPGDPPVGQRLLREAFECYQAALGETDPQLRAQRLCHGNLLIGMHEQTRLQPQIAAAMNAAIDETRSRDRLLTLLLPGTWRAVRYRIAALFGRRPPLDHLLGRLLSAVQRELRHLLTANAMTLHFPAGVAIRLGRDVRGTPPPSLARITEPGLAALLQRIDPDPDSLRDSGASDWSALDERLHLIADLFRCRHEWEPLFTAPYSPAQLESLRAGRLPDPPL